VLVTVGKRGRWPTADTSFFRTPTCTSQIACDGVSLQEARREKGTCASCEKAAAKRGKTIPPRGGKGWEE
jgi:hypothetical protein